MNFRSPTAWTPLKVGDPVAVIAPGKKTTTYQADTERVLQLLEHSWGLKPHLSDDTFGDGPSYYHYANTHQKRSSCFVEALHSEAAAIFCYRGGYGSDWVIEGLLRTNGTEPPAEPKVLVGFSDATTLHAFIHRQWGWSTIHGFSPRDEDLHALHGLLFGTIATLDFELIPLNAQAREDHELTSCVVGGNLTTLQAGLLTPWQVPARRHIVLLEDVGEAPYRVARMLHHLAAAQYFAGAEAVVFGDFTCGLPGAAPQIGFNEGIDAVLHEFAAYLPLPVLRCPGVGHDEKNRPMPLNTTAHLRLGRQATLRVNSGAANVS